MTENRFHILKKPAKVAVIGSGFAGLSAAALLARRGAAVTVFEKNETTGGRARTLSAQGFTFDMGPSWYWMPDVYERFFNLFGQDVASHYQLKKLDPGFAVIFGDSDIWDIPADFDSICALFEQIETGAGARLRQFIAEGELKYNVGMGDLVYKPGHSIAEFMRPGLLVDALKIQLFTSFSKHARRFFKDPRLLSLIEFPVLLLGAMPRDTPALYSLMNFSGLKQGTFYPMGGFGAVADAFKNLAEQSGVEVRTAERVEKLETRSGKVKALVSNGKSSDIDALIGSADYHHIEQHLLPEADRTYDEAYWQKRTFAPSSLLFYLGINKKVNALRHHNLFFDEDFDRHAADIYQNKKWPEKPLFYVCCPSRTDPGVAPEGQENIFVLMPIAIGLHDEPAVREQYYNLLMARLEKFAGENIRDHVVFRQSYCTSDFIKDYNAYQGNAYGLANTLLQTAIFKPKLRSKKLENLFYAGQLTVPGPGVPPSIISGQIAANELLKFLTR